MWKLPMSRNSPLNRLISCGSTVPTGYVELPHIRQARITSSWLNPGLMMIAMSHHDSLSTFPISPSLSPSHFPYRREASLAWSRHIHDVIAAIIMTLVRNSFKLHKRSPDMERKYEWWWPSPLRGLIMKIAVGSKIAISMMTSLVFSLTTPLACNLKV